MTNEDRVLLEAHCNRQIRNPGPRIRSEHELILSLLDENRQLRKQISDQNYNIGRLPDET